MRRWWSRVLRRGGASSIPLKPSTFGLSLRVRKVCGIDRSITVKERENMP